MASGLLVIAKKAAQDRKDRYNFWITPKSHITLLEDFMSACYSGNIYETVAVSHSISSSPPLRKPRWYQKFAQQTLLSGAMRIHFKFAGAFFNPCSNSMRQMKSSRRLSEGIGFFYKRPPFRPSFLSRHRRRKWSVDQLANDNVLREMSVEYFYAVIWKSLPP